MDGSQQVGLRATATAPAPDAIAVAPLRILLVALNYAPELVGWVESVRSP